MEVNAFSTVDTRLQFYESEGKDVEFARMGDKAISGQIPAIPVHGGKLIYSFVILLQPKYTRYSRRVYSFLEMLGDVGGLNDAIQLIFGALTGLFVS